MKRKRYLRHREEIMILLLLLFLIVAVIGGFLIYDRVRVDSIKKQTEESATSYEEPIVTALSLQDPLVQQLYHMMTYTGGNEDRAFHTYFYEKKKLTVDEVGDEQKHNYGFQFLRDSDITITGTSEYGTPTFTIPDAAYKRAIEEMFGPGTIYSKDHVYTIHTAPTSYGTGCFQINYQFTDHTYYGTSGVCEKVSQGLPLVVSKLINANQMEDRILLKESFLFTKELPNGDGTSTYQFYRDANHTELITTKERWTKDVAKLFSIHSYIQEANTITYVFQKAGDGQYYYQSSYTNY